MKHLALFCCLFCGFSLSAQYDRGSWYLDGGTAGEWQTTDYGKLIDGGGIPPRGPFDFSTAQFASFRAGYFPLERLLIGTRLNYRQRVIEWKISKTDESRLLLKPFVRYYVRTGEQRRVNVFGELGFGTIGFGEAADRFETDFHLGAGAEIRLQPGILGTANLNYNSNAWGLNYTTLDLGLNVLTGQLTGAGTTVRLGAGSFTATGSLGSVAYGRMERGGDVDSDLILRFAPSVGYFLFDGLLVEVGTDLAYTANQKQIGPSFRLGDSESFAASLHLDARYYVLQRGRLLPYLTAGIGRDHERRSYVSENSLSEEDSKSETWRAGGGFSYFFAPRLALDASVRYEPGSNSASFVAPFTDREVSFNRLRIAAGVRFFFLK